MSTSRSLTLLLALTVPVAVGCGGGSDQKKTTRVNGVVTFNGQPVKGGTVTFVPVAENGDNARGNVGKPANGVVNDDGTYSLSTYADGDGAILGQHVVRYSPPAPVSSPSAGHAPPTFSPYRGLVPSAPRMNVEKGQKSLDIQLRKA